MAETHAFIPGCLGAHPIIEPPSDCWAPMTIANSLSHIQRYAGALEWRKFSVARHSLLVFQLLGKRGANPSTRVAGLLHDAAEIVTGDITRPMKQFLGIGFTLNKLQDSLTAQCLRAFQIDLKEVIPEEIGRADDALNAAEAAHFFAHRPAPLPADLSLKPEDFESSFLADRDEFYRVLNATLREALP